MLGLLRAHVGTIWTLSVEHICRSPAPRSQQHQQQYVQGTRQQLRSFPIALVSNCSAIARAIATCLALKQLLWTAIARAIDDTCPEQLL